MRLSVDTIQRPTQCFTIPQRYAAFTKGSSIGTTNLFNCMGIVIHNRVGAVGAVAHVEAQSSGDYPTAVGSCVQQLLEVINANGGDKGSLSVVLLGNAGNAVEITPELRSVLLNTMLIRLNKLDIMDLRNGAGRGLIGVEPTVKGMLGACIYNPGSETVWVGSGIGNQRPVPSSSQPEDVKTLKVQ
jgi:hypothetical protein